MADGLYSRRTADWIYKRGDRCVVSSAIARSLVDGGSGAVARSLLSKAMSNPSLVSEIPRSSRATCKSTRAHLLLLLNLPFPFSVVRRVFFSFVSIFPLSGPKDPKGPKDIFSKLSNDQSVFIIKAKTCYFSIYIL